MKCQRQIRWFDFVSNIDVLARIGLTPLSDIRAAHRISVFGHIARLENDVPAHMALRRHVDLCVGRPPGNDVLVDPALAGSIKFGVTRTPVEFWRNAVRRNHGVGPTQRPSPATRS